MNPAEPSTRAPILVVDDNRDTADSMVMLLELEGLDATPAYSAQDALEILDGDKPYGVVICDVRMPDVNGFDLFRAVRYRFPAMHVILVTGKSITDDDVLPHGAQILRKPVEAKALLAALKDV